MTPITAVLSGPQGKRAAAIKALEAARFRVHLDATNGPLGYDHGHAASTATEWTGQRDENGDVIRGTGEIVAKKAAHPAAFLTVDGDDVDRAIGAVESLGWHLRSHWNVEQHITVIEQDDELAPAQRLARVEQDLRILKGGK